MEQSPISLYCAFPRGKYGGVIAGAGCLWFYHLFFSLALPVAFPAFHVIVQSDGLVCHFGGISPLGSCLVTSIGGSWETAGQLQSLPHCGLGPSGDDAALCGPK